MFRSYLTPLLLLLVVLVSWSPSILAEEREVDNHGCSAWNVDGDPAKVVCVCREGQCHRIDFEWPAETGKAILIETTRLGRRFEVTKLNPAKGVHKKKSITTIRVSLGAKRQVILGWGGAFTDATGINLRSLPPATAELLLESYFGEYGLRYNIGRVPIGGTDFSTRAYTYDDSEEPDLELKNWSLANEDTELKIPYVKRAIQMVKDRGDDIKLIASPWSAPKWMKTSNSLVRGHLIDSDEIYASYTRYLMKFYDAYEKEGIKFWGATVQNEPVASYLPFYFFNSMQFSSSEMAKLISKHLGPALAARGWTKDNFKLMIGDDSLGFINVMCPPLLRNEEVMKYVSGLAYHWYTSGLVVPYKALDDIWKKFSDKLEFMMMTEASAASVPLFRDQGLGNWGRAESYANDIIEDLARNTAAWVDWNLALSMTGGPNWAHNEVDSPIKVNAAKGEFYKQPMYYALAHFTRLFLPGSVRLETEVKSSSKELSKHVSAVAVHNEESGHVVVNILNKSKHPKTIDIQIELDGKEAYSPRTELFQVSAKSISSFVVKL